MEIKNTVIILNHFLEFGRDDNDQIWITIHSGSRNLGAKIARFWQGVAIGSEDPTFKEELSEMINTLKGRGLHIKISKSIVRFKKERSIESKGIKGLEYLEGSNMWGYLEDMMFAQIYASENRKVMMKIILSILGNKIDPECEIESIHNYIDFSDLIVRKGAIRSYTDELMIIPFSQEAGLLVCEGKSNPDWNFSAPHGAGRVLSRTEAKKTLSLEDYETRMSEKGIFSTSINKHTLDECGEAYKDPEVIREAIEPTATIINTVFPIHNLKDDGRKPGA